MIKGWNHFANFPEIVTADKLFWNSFLFRNLDKIVTVLANIPEDLICVVCGMNSLNYSTRSSLAHHIKHHVRNTIDYWLNNIISKSPEELEAILYFDGLGNVKENGVIDY